jgi:hypothetical protein
MKPQKFTDDEVQQILSRAVQIDATAPERLTVDQIRVIATELGVSEAAVERAIEEYSSARVPTPRSTAAAVHPAPVRTSWLRQPLTIAALVAATLLAALFASRVIVERPADVPGVEVEIGR